jgi:hypothetical protein
MMSRQLAGLVNENIRPNGSVTIWFQLSEQQGHIKACLRSSGIFYFFILTLSHRYR